ncbi:uncharacterized protein LOC119966687 [Scyliorhinus canicula]|uniref:uncharacterized protein LOC119966687 n=1 Tax=Scyliorhinus canicula TaxID=7830 RepID=UPI0018F466AC|nr:uncharacterized protein LOC119966687 [Scyliorhinus canicula]XP_038654677.1 uncharacterized protein LOC119966687 [Scyliorhinus canicula]
MAPAPQGLEVASGLLHFPQLFLIMSIVLLILLVITCTSLWRLAERIRKRFQGHEGQKVMSMKKHNVPVPKLTNANGVMTTTIDQQIGKGGNISLRRVPSIPLTSFVQIEESNDDSLYEVVRDIQLNVWQSEQTSSDPENLEYMTPCKEVSSEDLRQVDGCSSEDKESIDGQTQAPIYAKIVKQRNKVCQLQFQGKLEANDEVVVEEPPPVPEKHLDDENSAEC